MAAAIHIPDTVPNCLAAGITKIAATTAASTIPAAAIGRALFVRMHAVCPLRRPSNRIAEIKACVASALAVSVFYEITLALQAPLDVFVVRKLGAPEHPELAVGAIATGGILATNVDAIRTYRITRGVGADR